MINEFSSLVTSLWGEFVGPTYSGTLYYLNKITGISIESLDVILVSVFMLASITVAFSACPQKVKDKLNITGRSTYDKIIVVLAAWIWSEINIRLGTHTTVVYLFGNSDNLLLGATSYALAVLPSLAQSLYMYKPSKRETDQQFEKTVFLLDIVGTGIGLGITAGYTPKTFLDLHLQGNPIVIMIWLFAWGGNYWAEGVIHDFILGGRALSKVRAART